MHYSREVICFRLTVWAVLVIGCWVGFIQYTARSHVNLASLAMNDSQLEHLQCMEDNNAEIEKLRAILIDVKRQYENHNGPVSKNHLLERMTRIYKSMAQIEELCLGLTSDEAAELELAKANMRDVENQTSLAIYTAIGFGFLFYSLRLAVTGRLLPLFPSNKLLVKKTHKNQTS